MSPACGITLLWSKADKVRLNVSIWLIALSERLPSAIQCTGFDISLAQSPSQAWLPTNVRMHQWDIFQHPPTEFVGSFDVVHVRHIHLIIKNNDVVPIVKHLRALLSTSAHISLLCLFVLKSSVQEGNSLCVEPNGYLQWDEVNPEANYIAKTDPAASTPALEHLFKKFSIPKGEGGAAE